MLIKFLDNDDGNSGKLFTSGGNLIVSRSISTIIIPSSSFSNVSFNISLDTPIKNGVGDYLNYYKYTEIHSNNDDGNNGTYDKTQLKGNNNDNNASAHNVNLSFSLQ